MMSGAQGTPIRAFADENYSKVFIVCEEGALSRKCLVCDHVFSRQESFEHSKFPCHALASNANWEPTDEENSVNEEKTTVTHFQFRLNGLVITHMKVRPVVIDGTTDHWELVAYHDTLGEFAIDDNEGLADPTLTRFVLEVRDVLIPPIERRYLPNKGWRRMSTKECLNLLASVGVIYRL